MSEKTLSGADAAETPQEMLDRLSLIALGDRYCDLSDNDTAALEWVLGTRAELYAAAEAMLARHDAEARAANFAVCGCDNCKPFRAVVAKSQGRSQS